MSDEQTPRGLKGLMYRLEPTPGRQRPHHHRNGLITLVLISIFVFLAMTVGYYRSIPFLSSGEQVKAEFDHIANLRVGNPVRVRGVKVGKVTKIERDADKSVGLVTMELDGKQDVDLKRDAKASILWRTLLGRNMYLQLEPGTPGAPELGDARIPRTRTESQIEFDQLFEALDDDGRQGVQAMFREFDGAFAEPGVPGQNLDRLAPTMRVVAPALQALRGERTGDIGRLTANTSRTMQGLARSEEKLAGLIDGANVTLGVTAARRADLGSFVRQAPATLRDTRTTTARLRTTLDLLDPVADRVRPGVRELDDAARTVRPALREATPLLRAARPLSDQLQGALHALEPASVKGVEVIRGMDPTLTRLKDPILPWLKSKNALGLPVHQSFGPVLSNTASAAQQFTALGHLMRFQGIAGGERSLGLPCATYFVEPNTTQRLRCDDFSTMFTGLFDGADGPTGGPAKSRKKGR
jgi:virulence factor Mce-like protein